MFNNQVTIDYCLPRIIHSVLANDCKKNHCVLFVKVVFHATKRNSIMNLLIEEKRRDISKNVEILLKSKTVRTLILSRIVLVIRVLVCCRESSTRFKVRVVGFLKETEFKDNIQRHNGFGD